MNIRTLLIGTRRRAVVVAAGASLVVVSAAVLTTQFPSTGTPRRVVLASSSCSGPVGAAYVTDPGYQGFTAVNTANCEVIQTYNDDDTQVPGDPGDYNYTGSAEGIALQGSTLWLAVTGTSNVAAIDTSSLDPSNYNPPETLIPVGLFPQELAVTPDGSQVWVADTGPQTSGSPVSGLAIIETSTDKVIDSMSLSGEPTDVTFSPSGAEAYVTTSNGLFVFDTSTGRQVAEVQGLGDPESVAVAPNGRAVYVTETSTGQLATILTATDQVVRTTTVGQLPWSATVSADSSTVYVADPDSNAVSVVEAATGVVTGTFAVAGDPDALALTPDGSQLWIGDNTSGSVTVLNAATGDPVGQINLGGDGAQSGDGLEPTGIVITSTPTAGS